MQANNQHLAQDNSARRAQLQKWVSSDRRYFFRALLRDIFHNGILEIYILISLEYFVLHETALHLRVFSFIDDSLSFFIC